MQKTEEMVAFTFANPCLYKLAVRQVTQLPDARCASAHDAIESFVIVQTGGLEERAGRYRPCLLVCGCQNRLGFAQLKHIGTSTQLLSFHETEGQRSDIASLQSVRDFFALAWNRFEYALDRTLQQSLKRGASITAGAGHLLRNTHSLPGLRIPACNSKSGIWEQRNGCLKTSAHADYLASKQRLRHRAQGWLQVLEC
jgi:hypothetical protein